MKKPQLKSLSAIQSPSNMNTKAAYHNDSDSDDDDDNDDDQQISNVNTNWWKIEQLKDFEPENNYQINNDDLIDYYNNDRLSNIRLINSTCRHSNRQKDKNNVESLFTTLLARKSPTKHHFHRKQSKQPYSPPIATMNDINLKSESNFLDAITFILFGVSMILCATLVM